MTSFFDHTTDFFSKAKLMYQRQAERIIGEEGGLKKLQQQVRIKLEQVSHHPKVIEAMEPILVFKRMIQAHKKGDFKVSSKSLMLMVLGLVYFVSPLDIIPDVMPVIGFADDLSVLIAVYNAIKHEVDEFLAWEKNQDMSRKGLNK
ncbi:DUF1232 domain-containing protein [Mongoliitalea daihaiensis]|nr:DUF1232 domain-containing protein [Mongoliitalea daihaiensis]